MIERRRVSFLQYTTHLSAFWIFNDLRHSISYVIQSSTILSLGYSFIPTQLLTCIIHCYLPPPSLPPSQLFFLSLFSSHGSMVIRGSKWFSSLSLSNSIGLCHLLLLSILKLRPSFSFFSHFYHPFSRECPSWLRPLPSWIPSISHQTVHGHPHFSSALFILLFPVRS